jgi:hypothetical protein
MIEIDIKQPIAKQSFKSNEKRFKELANSVSDLRPVWKQFIPYYQDTIVEAAFNTQGKIMGRSWAKYSPAYLKQIRKGKISGTKMKRSETLYRAAKGGSGWYDKQGKKKLEFGLNAPIYAGVHTWGYPARNIPRRDYFQTTTNDIPQRAWAFLIKTTDNYIEGSFDE